ncbi:MAG: hypothetical protein GXP63_02605 [DPANN group archaeon]|nr:hypothetical protein [DPANN group archaeon]
MKRTEIPERRGRTRTRKRAQATVLPDSFALLGIILVAALFIIMLSVFKDRPDQKINQDALSLNTDTALLTFLRTPADQGSGVAFAGAGGADVFDKTLTLADLIILGQYQDERLAIVREKAKEMFFQRYGQFWNLDIEYSDTLNANFGYSYFWDKAQTYAESVSNAVGSSPTGPSIYVPQEGDKAVAVIYLPGLDHTPIKITLTTWMLFAGTFPI